MRSEPLNPNPVPPNQPQVGLYLIPSGLPASEGFPRPISTSTGSLRMSVPIPLSVSEEISPVTPPLGPDRVKDITASIKEEASAGPSAAGPTTVHIEEAKKVAAVAEPEIALCNVYGAAGSKAHYCGLEDSQQNILKGAFAAIKQHCLGNDLMPKNASEFRVNLSKRTVRFLDPATNHIKVLDLETMINNDLDLKRLVDQAETLIVTQINRGEIRRTRFAADNKGSADGGKPLIRPAYLESLPKSTGPKPYEQAMDLCKDLLDNDAKRDQAVYRMAAAEIIMKRAKDKLTKKITPLETEVERLKGLSSRTPVESAELEKQWRILQELKYKLLQLEDIDTFALYLALALYPTGADADDPQKVAAAAKQLNVLMQRRAEEIRLQKEKEGSKRTWLRDLPLLNRFSKEVKFEPSRFYPIDVGGLMFSGLEAPQARASYVDYCKLNKVYEKTDGIEDALMRKVLRPGDPNPILDGLFDDITEDQDRNDLQRSLNRGISDAVGLLANQRPPASESDEARIAAIRNQVDV